MAFLTVIWGGGRGAGGKGAFEVLCVPQKLPGCAFLGQQGIGGLQPSGARPIHPETRQLLNQAVHSAATHTGGLRYGLASVFF